ncbi:hypothetical protein AXG93_4201s1290 [Marchantia polymorpha subsp. ruderalis]|uniref:Secreted protein n=1 Tax=Marchantia polymorpha subsp. ruderalis TaxID=1480154 RepID=A0A176WAW6_MARPO|nr:hypothetical protein AXG93_4201s1290 [Marchantia polymorpha subsp. ruderalis]
MMAFRLLQLLAKVSLPLSPLCAVLSPSRIHPIRCGRLLLSAPGWLTGGRVSSLQIPPSEFGPSPVLATEPPSDLLLLLLPPPPPSAAAAAAARRLQLISRELCPSSAITITPRDAMAGFLLASYSTRLRSPPAAFCCSALESAHLTCA